MADASNLQTSFLGGEWSPYAQGRADEKDYRIGMSSCLNGYPIEAGAWTRRQGTRFCATTRYGQPGWLLPFAFAANAPYTMEFTNQILRFFNGPNLVGTNDATAVLSISSANPAVVTLAANVPGTWANGDMCYFIFKSDPGSGAKTLFMRQFLIGSISGATFTLTDPISNTGIDGSTITLNPNVAQVVHIQELASPYNSQQLTSINKVQAESVVVTLCPAVAPYALTETAAPSATAFATFSFSAATFLDGPYQDPISDGTTLTPSAKTGSVTLSSSTNKFVSTDVGRLVRIFSEPAAWASGTAYSAGNVVKYTDGLYYQALASSTGSTPPQNPTLWAVDPTAAIWSWAKITAYTNATNVTATIKGPDLLYTTAATTWRLGLYSDTTGYPTCGCYHEGRLWLFGAQGNRIDGSAIDFSQAAGTFNFKPTEGDGTVTDADAISYVFNAEDVNEIYWGIPFNSGILCGTQGGEWMIAASQLNDPLTPTSIQAHRRSKYKCANVPPAHTGLAVAFVQADQFKLMEYVADVFSGKMLGRNLSVNAKHLTTSGIEQISYQQELAPIIWARTGAGQLIGTTYKRESSFTSEPPTFNGWHQHTLGSGRTVESISVGPNITGNSESLTVITNQTNAADADYNVRHVEILTDMFDENNTIYDAWFLDDALTPSAMTENTGATTLTFYGYYHLVGKTVSGWIAGIDAGDATVAADGSVQFPVNAAGSLLTDAALDAAANSGENFGGLGVYLDRTVNVQYPTLSGNSVQSYIATLQASAYIDDYAHNRVYSICAGSGTSGSIAIFNRLTGAKILERTSDDIFGVGSSLSIDPGGVGAIILGVDGYLYFNSQNGNTAQFVKVNATTLVLAGQFGITGGNDNTNVAAVRMGLGVHAKVKGVGYLVHTGEAFAKLGVINTDAMQWAGHDFTFTEGEASGLCVGETLDTPYGYQAFYSVASDSTHFSLYKTTITQSSFGYVNPPSSTGSTATRVNGGITTTKLHTFAPTDIDSGWSDFTSLAGCVYDPLDGNVIVLVVSALAATPDYVVKINPRTNAIVWKTAVLFAGETGRGIYLSNIKNGVLAFLGAAAGNTTVLHTLNTNGGSDTSDTTLSITSSPSNCVDNDGSVVSIGTWGGTGLTGLNGTTSFTSAVYKIQGVAGFPGQTTETQSEVIPAVIGFNYTSQGAALRALAPDASGARNGPALGKTRRHQRLSAILANAQGVSFGTDLTYGTFHPAQFKTKSGKGTGTLNANVLYTGIHSDTFESDYDYDNVPSWKITRSYPATVCAIQGFLHTQDR